MYAIFEDAMKAMEDTSDEEDNDPVWEEQAYADFNQWWSCVSACKNLQQWKVKTLKLAAWPEPCAESKRFEESIQACGSKLELIDLCMGILTTEFTILLPENRTV